MIKPSDLSHRVCLVIEDHRWENIKIEDIAVKGVNSTLGEYDSSLEPCEIHVLATDDKTIQKLNSKFRNENKPTNVLSWQAGDLRFPDTLEEYDDHRFLGDIAVSFDTLLLESENYGLTLDSHLSHLLVHSTLHLLGFTHNNKTDQKRMENLETRIMASMGFNNPYVILPQDFQYNISV